jgi:hypothetical protein
MSLHPNHGPSTSGHGGKGDGPWMMLYASNRFINQYHNAL